MIRAFILFFLLMLGYFLKGPASYIAIKEEFVHQQTDTAVIYLRDFGLEKTRKKDCTDIIKKALKEIDNSIPTIIRFPRGEYHFYPDESTQRTYNQANTSNANSRNCAILFENRSNLIVDGNKSRLIFHNETQPFTFDNCTNIILKNITIDWEQPLTAQAKITKVNDEFIELAIDFKEYPYQIVEGKLFFVTDRNVNETWKTTTEFDNEGRFIASQTGDAECLGREWENYLAEDIIPGIIRLYYPFNRKPKVGNILVLQHAGQNYPAIFIQESKDITINNVNIFHAPGVGILFQNSTNLKINHFKAIPNKINNRYFSCGSAGLYISNCTKEITIDNCEFDGLLDDAVIIKQ